MKSECNNSFFVFYVRKGLLRFFRKSLEHFLKLTYQQVSWKKKHNNSNNINSTYT